MKIVYYHNIYLGISPVKTFLAQYALSSAKTEQQREHRAKAAIFIDQTIRFIAEHRGRPIPPSARPLRGYPFHEMRIKDSNNLIRILYFCYHQETLVLLYAFDKPDYYDKAKKKKVEKEFYLALEQAYSNYQDYIKYQYYETY
ncbi:MAG: type II toxin-antitoxin system RelE/ParE family toxin [Patescibacteria group bacterium]